MKFLPNTPVKTFFGDEDAEENQEGAENVEGGNFFSKKWDCEKDSCDGGNIGKDAYFTCFHIFNAKRVDSMSNS